MILKGAKQWIARLSVGVLIVSIIPTTSSNAAFSAISWSGTCITGSSIAANTAMCSATASTLNFTVGTALTTDGNTITFYLSGVNVVTGQTLTVADLTLTDGGGGAETLEASPGTADNGAHEVTITNGASGNADPTITITLDNSAGPVAPNFATGASGTLVFASNQLRSSTTVGNYATGIVSTSEMGAGMLYVGDDNDVTVTATVGPTLSMVIRNSADSADTNTCDLGVLSSASVSTCAYRLAVATNAANGFQVQITSSGGLVSGGDDINAVAENDTVTAGSEEYGIAVTGATAGGHDGAGVYDQPVTENGDFSDDDTPIPTSPTNFISFTDTFIRGTAPSLTETTLITHRASITGGTAAGSYTQTVTYTITGSF